jgi:hypothetical protein
MPTPNTPQTLEPVHVRADQPTAPASSIPARPTPSLAEKPVPLPPAAPVPQQKPQSVSVKKPQKQAGNGVALAIVATVIIILGLAALAVLAYIKTKK